MTKITEEITELFKQVRVLCGAKERSVELTDDDLCKHLRKKRIQCRRVGIWLQHSGIGFVKTILILVFKAGWTSARGPI